MFAPKSKPLVTRRLLSRWFAYNRNGRRVKLPSGEAERRIPSFFFFPFYIASSNLSLITLKLIILFPGRKTKGGNRGGTAISKRVVFLLFRQEPLVAKAETKMTRRRKRRPRERGKKPSGRLRSEGRRNTAKWKRNGRRCDRKSGTR